MSTNYMTVLESEIFDIEPRLWRLKLAIEVPDPKFECDELDEAIMKLRFDTTLRLYHILQLQHQIWNSDNEEKRQMLKTYGSAERMIDSMSSEPDYRTMQIAYENEMKDLDETNRFVDTKWMSITRPEDSIWKDYPDELKKKLLLEADRCLRKTMGKKAYEKMKKECDEDRKLDHFQRYEKSIAPHFSKAEVSRMLASERKYYKNIEKWNSKGGLQ